MKKFLNILLAVCITVTTANYLLYLLKLLIFPEQYLAYISCVIVLSCVLIPVIFRNKFKKILKKAYVPLKAVFSFFLAFYTVTFCAMCFYIFEGRAEEKPPEELPSETVFLVFGAKVNGDAENCVPGVSLRKRLDRAALLMKEAPDSLCIVSGGRGADESRAEGDVMLEYLVSKGISRDRIYSENTSANTLENIENSLMLMKKEGLEGHAVACVSTEFHIPRIKLLCKKCGIFPVSCYLASSPDPFTLYTSLVREYMSYGKLIVFGHL